MGFVWIIDGTNAQEVIEQIKHLPPAERAQVTKFVVEHDDSVASDDIALVQLVQTKTFDDFGRQTERGRAGIHEQFNVGRTHFARFDSAR
jgi:hypothetical protein